jgi:hypothetical protein
MKLCYLMRFHHKSNHVTGRPEQLGEWRSVASAERTCLLGLFRSCTNGRISALQANSMSALFWADLLHWVYRTYNHSHILVLQRLARFLLYASHPPSYSGQAVGEASRNFCSRHTELLLSCKEFTKHSKVEFVDPNLWQLDLYVLIWYPDLIFTRDVIFWVFLIFLMIAS